MEKNLWVVCLLCAGVGLLLALWGFFSVLTVDEYARDAVESIFRGLMLVLAGLALAAIPHALVSAWTRLEALNRSAAGEKEEDGRTDGRIATGLRPGSASWGRSASNAG